MHQDLVEAVKSHPRYQELVCSRRCFALNLTLLISAIYYGLILIIAFAPSWLGKPIAPGAATTIGIPIGIGVILSAIALTGIYVAKANSRFDALMRAIQEDVQ